MSTLEGIKKAFPNMFRPLKWHHFDGPTEHGCGEWYAHATRGMYHIYDVREKFPNDRPFYAKEMSDQFDTLEQAQDAVQNRHELDIVMCLDPDFRSTLESLQRENEALKKDRDFWKEQFQVETRYRIELADRGTLLALTDANSRAEAAEAEVKRLQAEIDRTARNRDMWKGQVERQAESLSKFREEEISLRETLFKCGSFIADRYQEGDPEYQVVLLVNSAICGKPALASAGGLS